MTRSKRPIKNISDRLLVTTCPSRYYWNTITHAVSKLFRMETTLYLVPDLIKFRIVTENNTALHEPLCSYHIAEIPIDYSIYLDILAESNHIILRGTGKGSMNRSEMRQGTNV